MKILYTVNILISCCLILAPIWWSRSLLQLSWLNPVSLGVISIFPFEIFRLVVGPLFRADGLFNPYYQFAVLITNLQFFAGILAIYFSSRLTVIKLLPRLIPRLGFYRVKNLSWASKVFFLAFLFSFISLSIKTGGVFDWLLNIRESYLLKREGNGIYYASAVGMLSTSYFFAGASSTNSRSFTCLSILYFVCIYILGSKGFVLSFFVYYLIIIWRLGQFSIPKIFIIALPISLAVMLANFFSNLDGVEFAKIAEYFDYYPNAAMFYTDYFRGDVQLFYGQVLLSSLWEYIPRALFPEKPFIYGILHVVEIYYPGGAESGHTPAFSGGVQQFADFGIFGVIVLAILNPAPWLYFAGLRYMLKERAFLNFEGLSGRSILLGLLLFAPSFGVFMPVGLIVLFLFFIIFCTLATKIIIRSLFIWR